MGYLLIYGRPADPGLRGDDYWQAWRMAEDIIGDRPVDLIEIEASVQSLRLAIERYGVEL